MADTFRVADDPGTDRPKRYRPTVLLARRMDVLQIARGQAQRDADVDHCNEEFPFHLIYAQLNGLLLTCIGLSNSKLIDNRRGQKCSPGTGDDCFRPLRRFGMGGQSKTYS
jgi:hypothetical protein